MVAYAAVSFLPTGAEKAQLGTVKVESDTVVAVSERLVRFPIVKVTEATFATLDRDQLREVVTQITDRIPDQERVIALDRVLASVDKSQIIPRDVSGVKADPPAIFYSTTPAVLVNIDGEPIWSPIKDNDLKFAVNTNWDLFQLESSKTFYLRHEQSWLKASDVKGPWSPAGTLPASFSKLPPDDNWKDVKAALPGKPVDAKSRPTVFVSTTPAEMLLLRGEPSYLLVAGTTDLLWVQNTDSDLFRVGKSGPVYYLVAGRWFSAPDFTGPWTFATTSLPEAFRKIPLEHPRSRVLAAVPGTAQAAEAVLLAQVPQTARVKKKELKAPEVTYQGAPKFDPIPQTSVSQAVNTDKQIIKVGDLYYMCFQGVWFVAKAPEGPWEVTGTVPKEIYEIPASSSAHNVTYVTVEDDDDDWATFAAVAGYTGIMIGWGCAVWGSGYYYPPYWGYGGYYPYLLSVLSDLRLRRLVQPVDRRLRSLGGGLWTLRRRGRRRALQPADGHLLARRGRLGTVRRARLRRGIQSAHRDIRADAPGVERLRQLGQHRCAARRRLGEDLTRHEQPHGQHNARDAGERWRRDGQAEGA